MNVKKSFLRKIDDVFGVEKQLQEIDKNYKVYFNILKQKFELHNDSQFGDSLCLTFEFEQLDSRAVTHVNKTKIENLKKVIMEIDNNNYQNELKKNSETKIVIEKILSSMK